MNDLTAGILGSVMIAVSVSLLVLAMYAAVKADCRNPPRKPSIATALVMEMACPGRLN